MGKLRLHTDERWSSGRDGAALVTAIFVVAILFAVVITATIMTQQEGRVARNVSDTVRAKMLAEGGVNIAMAALKADLSSNRAITSIARIMQTYYGNEWKQVYDLILDGRERDIPDGLWLPAYSWDDVDRDGFNDWLDVNGNMVRDPGEPDELTVLVGRYVFAIVDEASKINVNIAGNPGENPFGGPYRHRSNEGVSAAEIDIGAPWPMDPVWGPVAMRSGEDGRANRFVYFRFGAPEGNPILGIVPPQTNPAIDDSAFPGAANVDDDFDTLFVSTDGIDNDGDGLVDEYVNWGSDGIDNDGDGAIDDNDPDEVDGPPVEGIDEPDEYRLFSTVTESVFASDGVDNDGDGAVDEPGEGGDKAFKTIEQLLLVSGVGESRFDVARDIVTVDSSDRDVIYSPQIADTRTRDLRVNVNLDDARTIAKTMIEKRPSYFGGVNRVRAFQIAANIADFRDKDFGRTEIVDNRRIDNDGDGRFDEDGPGNGDEDGDNAVLSTDGRDNDGDGLVDEPGEGIDEDPPEPGVDNDGDGDVDEDWIDGVDNDGDGDIDEDPPQADVYAGIESIRINEIMVRPTRRVEAETGAQDGALAVPGFENVASNAESAVDPRGPIWTVQLASDQRPSYRRPPGPPASDDWYLMESGYWTDLPPLGNAVPLDEERHTLTLQIGPSELVPDEPYYVILDFSIPDPFDRSAPVQIAETDIEYRVSSGVFTNRVDGLFERVEWQDLENSIVPGQIVVDFQGPYAANSKIDPVPSLPILIEIRKADEDGLPAWFNAVILSQEPDREWVELVNVGKKPVRLDDWELEFTGGAIGTIPPNTVIGAGDLLLLAVDKNDYLSFPLGADPDLSIFNNLMSMMTGPSTFVLDGARVVQLIFRNNAIEAAEQTILQGGIFPNDPRSDGNDNDGDNTLLSFDNLDNDGDGEIDEGDEGVDEEARTINLAADVPVAGEMQVVTLYEGPAQWGRVVDRVTYSSAEVATSTRPWRLVRNYPDLDFYRSLERINPYYSGDRPRNTRTNDPLDYVDGGCLDGCYDDWSRNEDVEMTYAVGSRFATPLYVNVDAYEASAPPSGRGDFELVAARVKNASFSTVGEIVDVPFYNPADPLRPTTITIPEAAAILELITTSRMDLTVGQSVVEPEVDDPEVGWVRGLAFQTIAEGAQAVWQWDIYDGLEDGVYNLYAFIGEGLWGHPDTRPVTIEVFSDINDDDSLDVAPGGADSCGIVENATARPDCVLSYGTVQVRGNMLAVRIVNLAETGVTNAFTRIALAPRRRDYGKININNVWPRTVRRTDSAGNVIATADIEPLSALPGLLQEWKQDALGRWRLFPSPDYSSDTGNPDILTRARERALAIMWLRGEEGYRSVGDLLQTLAEGPPVWLDALDDDPAGTNMARLKQTLERFKRISNLVTERSDVFEIICIAQAGQYFDGEFVPVGEKKIRVIYER